jgi:hypothetical protein
MDNVDASIETMEKYAPTIGVMPFLPGYEGSGSVIVMTDSACIDSASSSLSKCFFLFDKMVKIATAPTGFYYF